MVEDSRVRGLLMPRRARIAPGEIIYHALNRANGRTQLFDKPEDYAAFERIMVAAMRRSPIRLLAYCLMPNHWHMVLCPKQEGEITEFLRWPRSLTANVYMLTAAPPATGISTKDGSKAFRLSRIKLR
jgi:REP element-mobilizing transposase RayT